MEIREIETQTILTRSSGYLTRVCSHSLQPYRGCAFGGTLCGVGCYAQHQRMWTRGRPWGKYLDVKLRADEIYARQYARERAWARRSVGRMAIFLSSSTEPFPPQERHLGVTARLLKQMLELPPDELILQTHSPSVCDQLDVLAELGRKCDLRVHLSIESDTDCLPGLPRPATSVKARIGAASKLMGMGIRAVVTVAPLLPIQNPHLFFAELASVADAVVIDHFIGGDGSAHGGRTFRTPLPQAMQLVDPQSVTLEYRDQIVSIAKVHLPGRIGIGIEGFAGQYG